MDEPNDQTTKRLMVKSAYRGCSRKGIAGIPTFTNREFTKPERENMNLQRMEMETLAPRIEGK